MSLDLQVSSRSEKGRINIKSVRRQNLVPAVVYGGSESPVCVSIPEPALDKLFKANRLLGRLLNVAIDGVAHQVFVKGIERHPYQDFTYSVDFQRVSKGQKIKMDIPIKILGEEECAALRIGAILNVMVRSTVVRCLADNLPEFLSVDVSDMTVGDAIYLSDVKLPKGVEIFNLLHNNKSYDHAILRILKSRLSQSADTDEDALPDSSDGGES